MKLSLSLVCLLASGMGAAAVAQTAPAKSDPPAAAPTAAPAPITGATKIAVINFQQAVGQTNEFQRDLADLRKKFEPRETALQQINTEIEAEKKQLQAGSATISDAERQTKLKDVDEKTKELQRKGEDLRNDEQEAGQDTFTQVANKVGGVMVDFSKTQGFGVVLDANQQNGNVLWAQQGVDITEAVIQAYNTKSGIPAPANPPSAPTPHAGTGTGTGTTSRPATTPHQ
jgi:outer membrane protein